ncbi:ATP-binding cassette domain-containing protein [Microbispora siamensis]
MTAAIDVRGVVKRFGETRALRGVDLAVPAGTVLGLLGPNGAGKTTMVRILATLERPDGGQVLVCGHDVVREAPAVRRRIGLTGQFAAVDGDISGRENLYMVARLLNIPPRRARARADEMLERFGLAYAGGRSARGYSGGMRRRLDLAISLVGDPQVLYLDEPTAGLDPHSRNELWEIVRSMTRQGVTVLLTTQHMEEAEALAQSITVMDRGRVVATGTPAELRARVGGQVLHIRLASAADRPEAARALAAAGVGTPEPDADDGEVVRLPLTRDDELTRALGALASTHVSVTAIDTRTPSLDEVFLTLTGGTREIPDEEPVTAGREGAARWA